MNQNQCIFTILFLSISFHHFIHTVAQSPPPYTPLEHISLDCGSAADATVHGRTWSADTNSTLYSLLDQNTQSTNSSPLVPPTTVVDPSLYTTARLSYSQFTYIFPLTAGPKFLRLYFYPATYKPNFNLSAPFFSVTANRYTLLSNFSAALHVQFGEEVYIREFCLFVEDGQSLNLTFTPTHEMPGAYAFINGIEIVSVPDFLYYSSPDERGVLFVGQGDGNLYDSLKTSTALELMYRINAASRFIPPEEDTGMFRRWKPDDDFVTDARPGSLLFNTTLHLKYSNDRTRFAAPDLVYQTARGMGPNKTVNERYNLTWEFQVDSGFTYLVRLHFCQFNPKWTKKWDLVFKIYINGELAESQADIVNWVGYGVPTFKDYGVTIVAGNGDLKFKNLSIALHPLVGSTGYSDATLNGVEIFKMSLSYNLNATNPNSPFPITPSTSPSPSSTSSKHRKKTGLIIILVGSISGLLALSVLLFLIFRRRRRRVKDTGSTSKWGPFTPSSTKSTTGRSSLPSDRCRYFSLTEIRAATRDFDKSFIIGSGGFGNVFKGLIDGDEGSTTVAIKRLKPESGQGAKEFETEIEMLSKLRHHNLVSLIGLCNENDEMILVYDYMSRGTFRDHLYNCDNDPLPWKQRLQICIGAAKGLDYLHTGVEHTIIHRDVKTTNILLDEKWVAKVSDFGLSKMGSTNTLNSHVSTAVKGSVGYLDPEYFRRRQITEKSDVYSFGVVLWEVLCAKPAVSHPPGEKPVALVELARKNYKKGTVDEIIDRYLVGKISPDSLNKFVELAISCLQENGTDRPPMTDVVCFLELALKSQESAEQTTASDGGELSDEETPLKWSSVGEPEDSDMFSSSNGIAVNSRISGFTNVTSNSDEQSYATIDSAEMRSGAVFPEILKPKGR